MSGSPVHVWYVHTMVEPEVVEVLSGCLDAAERERAAGFRDDRRRTGHIVAHAAARLILCRYLGGGPRRLRLRRENGGKPYLDGTSGLRFNMTHSGEWVLLAVSGRREVEVDVEKVEERLAPLVLRYFTAAERRLLTGTGPPRAAAAARLWTRKEACVKAAGVGMFAGLGFEVADGPVARDPGGGGVWRIHDLAAPPGYAAALAVSGAGGVRVRSRRWRLPHNARVLTDRRIP